MKTNLRHPNLDSRDRLDVENEFSKLAAVTRWTPVLTFGTKGDLSVSYTTKLGDLIRTKSGITASFFIVTSAFSFSTASGNLQITGLPYTASLASADSGMRWVGSMNYGGITKSSYTTFVPTITAGSNVIQFTGSGSGQTNVFLTTSDVPTGGSVVLNGTLSFRIR